MNISIIVKIWEADNNHIRLTLITFALLKIVIIVFFSVAGGPLEEGGPGASAPCAPLLIRPCS